MSKAGIVLSIITLIFLLPSRIFVYGKPTTDPTEVKALTTIRKSLNDPKNLNWTKGDPCLSNWTGIYCDPVSDVNHFHVTIIHLLRMNLSGTLSPQFSSLSHLKILDFMWNNISGEIPKEIGSITSLKLLLLNGNQLSGYLPYELGNLTNLTRLQVDQNQLSGPIPTSFANLTSLRHLHMNNNSLSGQIPAELSKLQKLLHLLVDNNNLSGHLPEELSEMGSIKILQFDNNNFSGTSIPDSYANIRTLLKLSVRDCSLQGSVPDFSQIPQLLYIDLSWNQLTRPLPTNMVNSTNITTIDVSHNMLNGTIPDFSGLPHLQLLALEDNRFEGSVPSNIWDNVTYLANQSVVLDFQNNSLTNVTGDFVPPTNVSVLLFGNPVCSNTSLPPELCLSQSRTHASGSEQNSSSANCTPCPTDRNYEYNPSSTIPCLCLVPLGVDMRLKSPGISDFRPYLTDFENDLSSLLHLSVNQLYIEHFIWEKGPRLHMQLKLYPNNTSLFNESEIVRLKRMLAGWEITLLDIFGPYDLLNFDLGSYAGEVQPSSSKLKLGAIAGIAIAAVAVATTVSVLVIIYILRNRLKYISRSTPKRGSLTRFSIKVEGVKSFMFEEMVKATNNFSASSIVGQGGYGKVYKGVLDDHTVVAIKRAHEESLQGSKEFCTEIELLSRLHHRNLVSLVGYCDEMDEQMLVYEFMANGTLSDHLSENCKKPLNFATRIYIALGSAKGILYLHTEANPPLIHRDVKASNILLDSKFVPKVADFGISKLAPVPDVEGSSPSHISTVVKGTPGYLDPEYFLTHMLTDKSDVYSLGVVFLELLTGMRPIAHGKNLVREVTMKCKSGNILDIIDSRMGSSCSIECIQKFMSLALKCCSDETDSRPSMSEVVRELETIWQMIPDSYSLIRADLSDETPRKMTHSTSSPLSVTSNTVFSSREFTENTDSGLSYMTPR